MRILTLRNTSTPFNRNKLDAYKILAGIYARQKKIAEAGTVYHNSLKTFPNQPDVTLLLKRAMEISL